MSPSKREMPPEDSVPDNQKALVGLRAVAILAALALLPATGYAGGAAPALIAPSRPVRRAPRCVAGAVGPEVPLLHQLGA
jgi:hypothetical protein